jgi:outer membrane receptor for ferric coprogen and ferric-rhodotorulic acid
MSAAYRRARLSASSSRAAVLLPLCWSAASLAQQDAESPAAVTLDAVTVTESAENPSPYTVEVTASSTRLPLSLRDTPQSLTVFTRQRLDDQNLQSVRDVLDNTTGVYSYAYDSERVVFTSRGFTIDNTLFDGVPVAPGLTASSTDASLDTAFYERIEIVRGATGLLSGAGSPSAAVNFVRKHADSATLAGSLGAVYGSWDDFRTVGDVSTPLTSDGSIRARLVGVYQNAESYQDIYENEKHAFYGVIDADLTASTRLSVGYDDQKTLPQGNTWGSFPLFFSDNTRTDWSRSVTTAADWSYWNQRTRDLFAEARQDIGGGWSLRASLTRRWTNSDANLFYVYGYPDRETGEGLVPYAYRSFNQGRQDMVDAYLSGPFELFGRKHELVVGGYGSKLKQDENEFAHGDLADIGDFYDWDGSYPQPTFSSASTPIGRNRIDQKAVYAALRLQLLDPLKLIVGARWTDYDAALCYACDASGANDLSSNAADLKETETTPYAGLVLDLGQQWSAFASYTKIFNPQTSQRLDLSYLDPLDGNSKEIGIKGVHLDGRLQTALTLFDTRQANVAVLEGYIPDEEFPEGNLNRPYYGEADGTRTRGFEFEASGELLPGWNVSAGWSHYSMKDADDNSVKPWIPRTLVRTFTTYQLPGALHDLTIGGGVNWQSKNHVDVADANFDMVPVAQKAVTLVNLMTRYQITPQFTAQLNAENLFDKKYYVIDEYGNLYFGQPASVAASLSYSF